MKKGAPIFHEEWTGNPKCKVSVSIADNKKTAKCILCEKNIDLLLMGSSELDSHAASEKHATNIKENGQSCIC